MGQCRQAAGCASASVRRRVVEVVGRERRVLDQRRSGRARPSCGVAAGDARREPCAALIAEWARGSCCSATGPVAGNTRAPERIFEGHGCSIEKRMGA